MEPTTPFRVQLTQEGNTIRVEARGIENTPVVFSRGARVDVRAGKNVLASGDAWTDHLLDIPVGEQQPFPIVVLRPTYFWPKKSEVIVTVKPIGGAARTESGVFEQQASEPATLIAAMIGAIAWALTGGRRVSNGRSRIIDLLGAGVAGFVAFAAPKFEPAWAALGIKSEELQPPTFFLLGLAVSYVGVGQLLSKWTGRDPKALTAQEVKTELFKLLQEGEAVRKPLREEVADIFFGDAYVRAHPGIVTEIVGRVLRVQYAGNQPLALANHLGPRVEQLCKTSYRDQAKTRLEVVPRNGFLHWTESISYELIRNPSDQNEDLAIRLRLEEEIPEALRGMAGVSSFGTMVTSIKLEVSDEVAGSVAYEATSGVDLILRARGIADAPNKIPVEFSVSPDGITLFVGLDFKVPRALRERPSCHVKIRMERLTAQEDGIYYAKTAQLTHKYQLIYDFGEMKVEAYPFEWRVRWEEYNDKPDHGMVDLDRWLVPGSGVCLSYSPSKKRVNAGRSQA